MPDCAYRSAEPSGVEGIPLPIAVYVEGERSRTVAGNAPVLLDPTLGNMPVRESRPLDRAGASCGGTGIRDPVWLLSCSLSMAGIVPVCHLGSNRPRRE